MMKQDWHPAELANALVRPWTKGELIIARVLNMQPEQIWSSRYANKRRTIRIEKKN